VPVYPTMNSLPQRKYPVHTPVNADGNKPPIVFVTVCAAHRRPILAVPGAARILREAWERAGHWRVGRYVIMPDHLHLFCAPVGDDALPLQRWVAFWKAYVTRHWRQADNDALWQRDFWDRRLRTDESYAQKWEYVRHNPVRHKLVRRAEDWPYTGEMSVLDWYTP
jgi:putative transposase